MLRKFAPVFVFALSLGTSSIARADIDPEPPDLPAEEDKGKGGGGCSVESPRLELAGLAALVLLISGARLRRRIG
jgi:hypothetical protein